MGLVPTRLDDRSGKPRRLRERQRRGGLEELAEDGALVVSELVSNALPWGKRVWAELHGKE